MERKKIMPNVNVLCCYKEKPIFLYNPLGAVSYHTIIINYVSKTKNKWAERKLYEKGEASFLYIEIQIKQAQKRLEKNMKPKKELDKWCLYFLKLILDKKSRDE